jgi:hypothetical protein
MADSPDTAHWRTMVRELHKAMDHNRDLLGSLYKEERDITRRIRNLEEESKGLAKLMREAARQFDRAADKDTRALMRAPLEWKEISPDVWEAYGYRQAVPYRIARGQWGDEWLLSQGNYVFTKRRGGGGLRKLKTFAGRMAKAKAKEFVDDIKRQPSRSRRSPTNRVVPTLTEEEARARLFDLFPVGS